MFRDILFSRSSIVCSYLHSLLIMFACISICSYLSIYLSIYLRLWVCIFHDFSHGSYQYNYLLMWISLFTSIYLSIYLFIYLCSGVCISRSFIVCSYLYLNIFVCMSTCSQLSIYLWQLVHCFVFSVLPTEEKLPYMLIVKWVCKFILAADILENNLTTTSCCCHNITQYKLSHVTSRGDVICVTQKNAIEYPATFFGHIFDQWMISFKMDWLFISYKHFNSANLLNPYLTSMRVSNASRLTKCSVR